MKRGLPDRVTQNNSIVVLMYVRKLGGSSSKKKDIPLVVNYLSSTKFSHALSLSFDRISYSPPLLYLQYLASP